MGCMGWFLDYYPRINWKLMVLGPGCNWSKNSSTPVSERSPPAPRPPPSALGPWDWDPANSVLLCQLLGHWAETARLGERERREALAQPLTHPTLRKEAFGPEQPKGICCCHSVLSRV